MAFQTSASIFENIFGNEPEAEVEPLDYFMSELSRYLRGKASPLAKTLGQHIQRGGELSAFTCREDMCFDFSESLYEHYIPFALITNQSGQYGFLVREEDGQKAIQARNYTLFKKSRMCKILSGDEMKKRAARTLKGDKSCLSIYGLSTGQLHIFKKKYAEYMDDTSLGIDILQDGTYAVTLPGKNCIKKNIKDGPDICSIYLEMILETGGPNAAKNSAMAELQEILMQKLAQDFEEPGVSLKRTPLWIIGSGKYFLRVSANGFVYGRADNDGMDINLKALMEGDVIQPDYRQLLISYTNRIVNPITTYNQDEVLAHFKKKLGASKEFDPLDIAPQPQYLVWKRGEKKMAKLLDTMITRKIQSDSIMVMDGRYHEKFEHYTDEMKRVLLDLSMGRLPREYSPEEVKRLRDVMNKYKLEGEMFEQTLIEMQNIDAVEITTTIARIADVSEKIEKEVAEQERIKQEQLEEKAMRARGRFPGTSSHSRY